ncbi:MAG: hypothetical protein ABL921_10630 [Pirellula sp.]
MNKHSDRPPFRTRIAILGLCLPAVSTSWMLAQDRLDQDSLSLVLPESSQLVAATHNLSTIYTDIERSIAVEQLRNPIWQSIIQAQVNASQASLLNPQPWFGLDWTDMKSITNPAAIAVFRDSDGNYSHLFLVQLGANAQQHPLVQQWITHRGGLNKLTKTSVGSANFFSTTDSKTAEHAVAALGSQWTCFSTSTKAIDQWLKTKPDTTKPSKFDLAANDPLPNSLDGSCRFWLAPWELVQGYAQSKEPKLLQSALRFGLDGLGVFQATLHAPSKSDAAWRWNYSQIVKTPLEKGMAILNYGTGPAQPIPKVFPAEMDLLSQSYIDIKPWFQGVSHAIDQVIDEDTPGNFADLLDSILTDPEGPKVDIRKELIYRIGPRMSYGSKTVSNETKTIAETPRSATYKRNRVWCCELQDATVAVSVLDRLFASDDEVKSERIGDFHCWSTKDSQSLFIAVSAPERQSICIAAIDGSSLYLANDADWLKTLLRESGSKPKANSPELATYLATTTADVSIQQAIDLRSWLKRSWLRLPEPSGKGLASGDMVALLITKLLLPNTTSNQLPRFEQIEPGLGVLVHKAIRTGGEIHGEIRLEAHPQK